MIGMLPAESSSKRPDCAAFPSLEWAEIPVEKSLIDQLGAELGISPVLARLLGRLGLVTVDQAEHFLHPRLADLQDPFLLKNLKEAVIRISQALANQERILVLGDYDVDGITSTTLVVAVLRRLGANPSYLVPRRLEEGYGLSKAVVTRVLEENKPQLFIALDCGTNAVEEVAILREAGVDVIILDHHRSKSALPDGAIVVNPHVFDDSGAPWINLCAVGIAFKLAHGLLKYLREQDSQVAHEIQLRDYLDFVAMGTIADLVPLVLENRILARHGLKRLSMSVHTGVRALFQATGLELGQEIHPVDVSFKLGPRINASGRLADGRLPLDMLLSSDFDLAYGAANELNLLNRQRQDIERQIASEAEAIVEASQKDSPGLVVYSPHWHSGVVGIVAGRLCRRFYRPAIVLGAEGLLAKGSGRSIPGVNLVDALGHAAHLLKSWGGHPMAVGVSLDPQHIEALQVAFNEAILIQLKGVRPVARLDIAAWITPQELTIDLLNQLDQLRPFGEGNPEPILGVRSAYLRCPIIPFGDNHFRFQLESASGPLAGVAWNRAENMPPTGQPVNLAIKFGWNAWNGRKVPQVELIDWSFG